ncbi:hypothetical protein E2C01_023557 [Portunus trituberculatus]|uniref:Uncharacterized protein n=1 Tax=Portunus trituberculatus TaxID=210409 RepID=A0A5B7EAD3_PORTR|nr:hypothetical protein [Portunus trituberculatus]
MAVQGDADEVIISKFVEPAASGLAPIESRLNQDRGLDSSGCLPLVTSRLALPLTLQPRGHSTPQETSAYFPSVGVSRVRREEERDTFVSCPGAVICIQ